MIINKSGITIRMIVEGMRVMGRATQGVKLINLKGKDQIAAVARVPTSKDEEDLIEDIEVEDVTDIEGETPADDATDDTETSEE